MAAQESRFAPVLAAIEEPAQRQEWRVYLDYHRRRYDALLAVIEPLRARRILDVGPMFEVALLRETGATVDTLGFANPRFPARPGERHLEADLNRPTGPGDGSYDAVIMAEVIEHLWTPPAKVLGYLATWLRPRGVLVVQTPNAVALHKRLRMLAGRNPLEPLRDDTSNPGHFHEYTVGELRQAATAAGLEVSDVRTQNYFGGGAGARAYALLGRLLPPSLRHGITAVLRWP
jgi:SAM-dependent methyltransferase